MRSRFFLVFFILVILGGAFYYFYSVKPGQEKLRTQSSPTIVQLMPFPMIISGEDGKKDNSLYELLINKGSNIISISNGRLDLSEFLAKKSIYFDHLFINFSYDNKDSKVKFNGHLSGNDDITEIHGEYYLGEKNDIIFKINFRSNINDLTVNSVYMPNSTNIDEGVIKGNFIYNTQDLFYSSQEFQNIAKILSVQFKSKEKAYITGEFEYIDQDFILKNASLKSSNIELNFDLNSRIGKAFDLITNLNIEKLNLDGILFKEDRKGFNKFISLVSLLVDQYAKGYAIDSKVTAKEINFHHKKLTDFFLDLECDAQKNVEVKDLSFTVNNSKIVSTGILSKNEYRPIYNGNLTITSTDFKNLFSLFGIKNASNITDNQAKFTAEVMMTPILANITNIKLNDDELDASGSLRISYYGKKFKAVYANLDINNFDSSKETILHNLVKKYDLFSNSNSKEFTDSIINFRKFKSIYDITINANNLKCEDQQIDNAKAQIVFRSNVFSINDIAITSPLLNFNGSFSIDVSQKKPYLNLNLIGDRVDGKFLLSLLNNRKGGKQPNVAIDKNLDPKKIAYTLPNYNINLFRLDRFDGYLKLKFKEVNFGKKKFFNLYFDSVIDDRLIKVKKMNLNMFDGYLQSVGNFTLNPFAFNIAYSYAGGNIGDIAKGIFNSNRFSGKLTMTGNIYSKGENLHELFSSSGGNVNFKLHKFLARRFNIDALVNTYGVNIPKDFNTNINQGKTLFRSFDGKGSLENGFLKITEGEFSAHKIDGKLNSEINLFNGSQNTVASLAFIDPNGKVDGFNISFVGPVTNPEVKLGTETAN